MGIPRGDGGKEPIRRLFLAESRTKASRINPTAKSIRDDIVSLVERSPIAFTVTIYTRRAVTSNLLSPGDDAEDFKPDYTRSLLSQ